MKIQYPALVSEDKDDQRFLVKFAHFDEAITEGSSLQEALQNAVEVLTLTLEGRMDEGLPIPLPPTSGASEAYWVAPAARVQAALLVRFHRIQPTAMLAKQLQTSWPAAARLEDPHHSPSLRQLERAASAMGLRLVISLEALGGHMMSSD